VRRSLAIALLLAIAPSVVLADDATEGRFFDQLGRAAFAQRHYDVAITHFLAAQAAAPSVRTLYNLALCAEAANRREAAFGWYGEYLAGADADADRRRDAEQRMTRLRQTLALVRVTSEPAGATIYVDRRELGDWGRTPRVLVLEPGEHTIELDAPGHHVESVRVTAALGEERSAAGTLRAREGRLQIDTNVAAAQIVVTRGERELARGAAGAELSVPVGACEVRVEAPEHQASTVSVQVREGALERRRVVLAVRPQPAGRLLVSSGDVHARLLVDGAARAETPAALDVGAGEHEVEVRADGYLPWRGTLAIEAGRSRYLSVTLVPAR
jgi:outer membrane receptor for ferrienterochelin and colicins